MERTPLQAKCWQRSVGRSKVQGSFGAQSWRRASKGVFITTSRCTGEAREFGVGVSRREVCIPEIDSDCFSET
ncbi:MAG: restriction endonuclease [Nannocystaceae bacterium]